MTKQQKLAAEKLGWKFQPSIDNANGIAQPEYWENEELGESLYEEELEKLLDCLVK